MTVSNAFSRPDQLSAELRDKIMAAADELGYVGPDPAARVLATGSAGTVGVLLTDSLSYAFEDEFAARFLGGIAEELAPTGLALTLLTSSGPAGSVQARDVPMDGALIYSCDETSSALSWLKRRHLPLVLVDQAPSHGVQQREHRRPPRRPTRRATRRRSRASKHRCRHVERRRPRRSHRRSRHVDGWPHDPATHDGLARGALGGRHRSHGRAGDSTTGRTPATTPPSCCSACPILRRRCCASPTPPPTASCTARRRLGVSVPDDLSVVGFDDVPLGQPHDTATHDDPPGRCRQGSGRGGSARRRDRPQPNRERRTPRATGPARRTRRSREYHHGPLTLHAGPPLRCGCGRGGTVTGDGRRPR